MKNDDKTRQVHVGQRLIALLILLLALVGGTGCAQMGIQQQRLVSKPNMVFDSSGAFMYNSVLLAQVEIGSAVSGGAQAAGCTACR